MPQKECTLNGLRWIHIEKPESKDIDFIKGLFPFHPLVIESIAKPTFHPLIEEYEDHLFLIVHFPFIYPNNQLNKIIEVDFLVTKDTVITIIYKKHKKIDDIFSELQKDKEIQERLKQKAHSGLLLYHVLDNLLSSLINEVDFLEKDIIAIERKIYQRRGEKIIEEISHITRDILDFRRPITADQSVLKLLPDITTRFYGKSMAPYFVDIIITADKMRNFIENQKEAIEILHHTSESVLSHKTNTIISVLTIFSAILLPLNLVSSIWGMNHVYMPLRDGRFDFWFVLMIMTSVTLTLLYLFRKNRWL